MFLYGAGDSAAGDSAAEHAVADDSAGGESGIEASGDASLLLNPRKSASAATASGTK